MAKRRKKRKKGKKKAKIKMDKALNRTEEPTTIEPAK